MRLIKERKVISVLLFRELDKTATCAAAKKFLGPELERLVLMSGHQLIDISSPALSPAPGHSSGNHNEDALIAGIDADRIVMATHETIHHCPEPSKTILLDKYVKHLPNLVISQSIYLGHTRFNELLNRALLEFVDGFDYWQRRYDCQPITDLHVYKAER
ncbi:MAG: hypothetical protein LKF01_00225 [Lactobacillus sp.]|jgi:ArpU family phage transcriptional regulator|nr:hypothetical protein [Lactobacillus sp.]MCH4067969.1 hypothetical protein [Lactobacillus sp.]MCI1527603.1 hypothetical protein [Lactobacillus sp.]